MMRVSVSFQNVFGDFDHKHHGVFGLVAEGFSDDVHSVMMGHALQGDSVHRHQLKSSLGTAEGGVRVTLRCKVVMASYCS